MSFKSLKLFHYPLTRSVRAKWMLHETVGEEFETEIVEVVKGAMHAPEMLAKNPNHNLPMLDITWEDASVQTMLESGAIVAWLADAFPEKQLAPQPSATRERADYLQMMLFSASWQDSMLWQLRLHRDLLPEQYRQPTTVQMYQEKWVTEIEPQLTDRLTNGDFICGSTFSAADCVTGHNIRWARSYGLCESNAFDAYLKRLGGRKAYQQAYSDAEMFGR